MSTLAESAYLRRTPPAQRAVVYFIQATRGGPVKIGQSDRVERRLADLQSASPYPLRIVATLDGTCALERELHVLFAAHRLHGEWFRPCAEIADYLRGLNAQLATRPTLMESGVMLPRFDVRPLPAERDFRRIVALLAQGGWWSARDLGARLGARLDTTDRARSSWASHRCTKLFALGWLGKRQRYRDTQHENFPPQLRNEYALRRLVEEGAV